jgi:hypothetical protein
MFEGGKSRSKDENRADLDLFTRLAFHEEGEVKQETIEELLSQSAFPKVHCQHVIKKSISADKK